MTTGDVADIFFDTTETHHIHKQHPPKTTCWCCSAPQKLELKIGLYVTLLSVHSVHSGNRHAPQPSAQCRDFYASVTKHLGLCVSVGLSSEQNKSDLVQHRRMQPDYI